MRSISAAALRPAALVLAAGLLPGCASSGGGVPQAGERRTTTQVQMDYGAQSFSLQTVEDVYVQTDTLTQAPGNLLRHVAATYDEMGIPLNEVNPEARLMGAVEARMQGDLGGRPLSRYFRCGTTITGSIADQYEVYLTVVTQVEPLGDTAAVVYTHAGGFAVQGGRAGNNIRCATRGRLEKEIFEHLQRKVRSQS